MQFPILYTETTTILTSKKKSPVSSAHTALKPVQSGKHWTNAHGNYRAVAHQHCAQHFFILPFICRASGTAGGGYAPEICGHTLLSKDDTHVDDTH